MEEEEDEEEVQRDGGGAGSEQQMEPAGAVKHLDRQISCYARDPPQGTSG